MEGFFYLLSQLPTFLLSSHLLFPAKAMLSADPGIEE
jgi:hypothetical protein